jgi:hypothetical protein
MGKDRTVYEPMDDKAVSRLNKRRWRRHRVSDLPAGVSLVQEGRTASFYVRSGNSAIELEAELSGADDYDLLVNSEGFARQIDVETLEPSLAPPDVSAAAKESLEAWLTAKGWRFAYFPESFPVLP